MHWLVQCRLSPNPTPSSVFFICACAVGNTDWTDWAMLVRSDWHRYTCCAVGGLVGGGGPVATAWHAFTTGSRNYLPPTNRAELRPSLVNWTNYFRNFAWMKSDLKKHDSAADQRNMIFRFTLRHKQFSIYIFPLRFRRSFANYNLNQFTRIARAVCWEFRQFSFRNALKGMALIIS